MVSSGFSVWLALGAIAPMTLSAAQDSDPAKQPGTLHGVITDAEFEAPLPEAQVLVVETGARAVTDGQGEFVFPEIAPGKYTLVIAKEGYARVVRAGVVVTRGQLTEVEAALSGDFTEMEPFVVQDLQIGGTEAALLRLRIESPALIDAISADLMSRAGAGDAAAALNLVSGTTVQDGKYAVIRGLPDRFVSSQLNGVRLPTADEDKRAVQLDQFPSAVIDNIRVSKTFTPDQQGDASGGAVDVRLKGIPDRTTIEFKSQLNFNSQVTDNPNYLTYQGGGVNTFGNETGNRKVPADGIWDGAAGAQTGEAPIDFKWSAAIGGSHEFESGVKVGGFASVFYERDSSFHDNGIDDSLWVREPGAGMEPETIQGTPEDGDFKTALFDVTEGSESVQWGALGTGGIAFGGHEVNATYLYTRYAEDSATLAQDTRGKAYYFPGHDPNDPLADGNSPGNSDAAPYIRTHTLKYQERITHTFILDGSHRFDIGRVGFEDLFVFHDPQLDWRFSQSSATLNEPDKRQFGEIWKGPAYNPGAPPFIPPFTTPAEWFQFKPAALFTLGNFQRIYKEIQEDSDQFAVDVKLPFDQWTGTGGYLKFGAFGDKTVRNFNQDTYSNLNELGASYEGSFEDDWALVFPYEDHTISDGPPYIDVDYRGEQRISATYAMADMPLTSWFKVIGGARWESTDLSIENEPEEDSTWFPAGAILPVRLNPGDADVDFSQEDVLPSIGFVFEPVEGITLRGSYSETIARQTFKELTPILQQEFLGGPIFIGNPELKMSALQNYDLRFDWTPYEGGLVSVSWFKKDVDLPIEYVQRLAGFTFTTPVNYPKGRLVGWEFEVRQDLGHLWSPLSGLALGGNLTIIDSEVTLPAEEAAMFESPAIMAPMSKRDMTAAPEHLYNLYLTYDARDWGTQVALFYTVKGDTLVAGAGQSDGNFVPDVYATEFDTLNLTISQKIGQHFKVFFQAKNLTNPKIEEVYRSKYIGDDVLKTSYTKGIDYAIGIGAEFTF